jgi:hypothetical protein
MELVWNAVFLISFATPQTVNKNTTLFIHYTSVSCWRT